MAKKTNSKKVPQQKGGEKSRKENSMTMAAIQVFVAGFLAELWLMVVRKYYVNGTVDEMLAFNETLKYSGFIGLGLLAVGIVLTLVWRADKKRQIGLWIAVIGAFFAASAWVCYMVYPGGASAMGGIVAVVTMLALAFLLYQREFVWSAGILGTGVLTLWVCSKGLGNQLWNTKIIIGAIAVVVVLLVVLLTLRKAEASGGTVGKLRLLPADASYGLLYGSVGASVACTAVALLSATIAYYLMWTLALCIFALVVYYTVKQL